MSFCGSKELHVTLCLCDVSGVNMHARTRDYDMHANAIKEDLSCGADGGISVVFWF